ncbi:ribonuclease E/G [Acanthopleuribacter pedis]|uniref:Ribonuclease E/G n=1 Tax=Acanthopleuribacter pedis TaxID=442870 RepID=A0A8J7Q9J4_9BACT|nr:ribonuclease E/G [Acanthopleuribacter pedis]MBO1321151.1 ribonuclease E/G [Acanthopleuribacter pedis]
MRSLLVNVLPAATRVAVTEAGRLVAYRLLDPNAVWRLGQVYVGRVTQVLPSIDACFVDVGREDPVFVNRRQIPDAGQRQATLKDLVKQGQIMRLQITKLPVDDKSPRGSGILKLGGFYLGLEEGAGKVRFSGHFEGDRGALKKLLGEAPFSSYGWRVRSAASHADPAGLRHEAEVLQKRAEALLRMPLEGANRLLEDTFFLDDLLFAEAPHQLHAVHCDDDHFMADARAAYKVLAPWLSPRLQRHHGPLPLFDTYKITSALERMLANHVWLKSGGSLLFHQSEAMVTIDVNTGKQRKGKKGQSAHLTTNLEAVTEAFEQIRLRNLAGLIAIDFLNHDRPDERRTLQQAVRDAAKADRADLDLEPINRFGVLVMTRQRRGDDFERRHKQTCPQCGGSGRIPTAEVVALRLQQELMRDGAGYAGETLVIEAGGLLFPYLTRHARLLFANLADAHGFQFVLQKSPKRHSMGYQINLS